MAAMVLTLIYLVRRDMGMYPTVFGDEWIYSSASRLTAYKDTSIPSYLYFSVFGATSQCGDRFLECSRIINAILFVAAAPFIYTIGRRLTTRNVAAAVALLSIAGPVNKYTSYFMPEAMYFLAFWIFSSAVFAFFEHSSRRWLAASAVLLGLMAMIKVHALFLVPGYCGFLLYAAYAGRKQAGGAHWLWQGLGWIALALSLALAVRMVGGYLFAGSHGLKLLGQLYGSVASNVGLGGRLSLALENLLGHVMALALLAGMPLAAFALHGTHASMRTQADKAATALLAYTVLMLGVLLAVTVMFTAAVASNGGESNARLHMRYYDFVLPLFLIFAGSQITRTAPPLSRIRKLLAALPLAALMVYASLALLPAFRPGYADSPALFGFTFDRDMFNLLTGAGLLALAAWVFEMRRGAQLFVFVFTPLFSVVAGDQINKAMSHYRLPDPYVKAGVFARHYLKPDELQHLVLVGDIDDVGHLMRTRFYIDDSRVQLLILPLGQQITRKLLPAAPYWLLIVGNHPAPPDFVSLVQRRDFALLQSPPDPPEARPINFAAPTDPNWVRLEGLSGIEPWGRWSNGKTVQIEFAGRLPREMTLVLNASAFGPNLQQDFVVRIGPEERRVRLPAQHQTVRIPFHTGGGDRLISIEVPHPVSPSQLGQGPDKRELGIALYSMAVEGGSSEDEVAGASRSGHQSPAAN